MDGMEIDARIDSSKRVKRSSPDDTNSAKPIWQHKPSSITVNSLEKRYSVTQKNLRNQNGKNGVIVSPNVGNSFSFQPCDVRIKGKELESKRNDRENSLVLEASTSNRLMVRKHDDITNRSIKDKEVSSHVGVRLKSQINGHDKALSKTSYIDSFAGNTGWAEAISRKNEEKSASQDPSGGVSTLEVKSTHVLHSESHHAIKKKGKLIFGDDMQYSEPTSQYIRASLFGKEVATIAEEQESSFKFGQNLDQQKCHDFKLNMQNQSLHEFQSFYNENFCSSNFTEQRHETDVENFSYKNPLTTIHNYRSSSLYKNPLTTIRHAQAFPDSVVNERNYSWKKHVKGKEKSKSSLPNFRKTSGPNLNQQSHLPSSESSDFEADKRNKNRCHGTTSMEIDNIYPEITNCTLRGQQIGVFDSCARASQIESDEKFARELQQQFYHETTRFIDMEKRYSSGTRLNDDSQPSALFESYSASAGLTPFRNFEYVERCPQMALLDEIRNNFNNEVVTETRLDLLEAMEDVLENSDMFEADDYTYNYSFNDTDHEMQLELDERSHRRARSSEINNLPVSFVQQNSNNSNNEACTVCLEIPSVGEKLRHLPCMHKFHKLCIDTWLKRKPSCPVCKSKIA